MRVEPPPFLIARQHQLAGIILAPPRRVGKHINQRAHIAQPGIQPLPRDGMHPVRRIANEHQPLAHEALGNRQVQRIGEAFPLQPDLPEEIAKPRPQHLHVIRIRERMDRRRILMRLRPDD